MIQIDRAYPVNEWKMNPRIDFHHIYLWLVFIFLFLSSLSRTFLPDYLNVVGVFVVFFATAYYLAKNSNTLLVFLFLILYGVFSAFSLLLIDQNILDLKVWSFLLVIILSMSLGEHLEFFLRLIKLFQ